MVTFSWKSYNKFSQKIAHGTHSPSLERFHSNTRQRMEIARHAFNCLKKKLPPKQMQDIKFRCSLNSFLTQTKSAIDSLTEEINLYYSIAPNQTAKGKTISIGILTSAQNKKMQKKLKQTNPSLFTEIMNATSAPWYIELEDLRNKEAVHDALAGKNWSLTLGPGQAITKLGIRGVSDLAVWCPEILKEVNSFLERCYKLM